MAVMALVAQFEQLAVGAAADGIANGGPAAERECAHQPDNLDGSGGAHILPEGSNKDEANGAVRLVESADARQEETKQKEGESSTQKRRRQRKEAESRRRVHRGGVQKNVVLKPNQYNNRRQGHWSQRTNTEVSSCDWQSTTTISTSWYWVRH